MRNIVLAFQSTQQAFTAIRIGAGLLFICCGIFTFVWHLDRATTTLDRWFYLLVWLIVGLGFIAFGWITYYS